MRSPPLVRFCGELEQGEKGNVDNMKQAESLLTEGETYTILCTLPLSEVTLVELCEFPG